MKKASPRRPYPAVALSTPTDMLAKLRRELNRAADSSFQPVNLVDHYFNCALTAWHLTDWVWHARFDGDGAYQDTLVKAESPARKRKGANNGRPPAWFKEYLTEACKELAYCQDVANGFKHVVALSPKNRVAPYVLDVTASAKVATVPQAVLGSAVLGAAALSGPGFKPGAMMYAIKIEDSNGNRRNAIEVFDAAVAFWTKFLAMHSLG